MLKATNCPNIVGIPDQNIGPWCQNATQGCVITLEPSDSPSSLPSSSQQPSSEPSVETSSAPSISPSARPSLEPSASVDPSNSPSSLPSFSPSAEPSLEPSASVEPSNSPSSLPSDSPSVSGAPSNSPTVDCSDEEHFRFKVKKNKAGIIKDLGGCSDYVAQNPKKRCKKKIRGKLVAFSCPVTCRKCTCEDEEKVTFKIKIGPKKKKKKTA